MSTRMVFLARSWLIRKSWWEKAVGVGFIPAALLAANTEASEIPNLAAMAISKSPTIQTGQVMAEIPRLDKLEIGGRQFTFAGPDSSLPPPTNTDASAAVCGLNGEEILSSGIIADGTIPDPGTKRFGPLHDTRFAGIPFGQIGVTTWLSTTHVGDVTIRLGYDRNRDGIVDRWCSVLNQPGYPALDNGCGADMSLANAVSFAHYGSAGYVAVNANGDCVGTSPVTADCYLPTGAGVGDLGDFRYELGGGNFYCEVSDNNMLDTTVLARWELTIDGQPTVGVAGLAQIHHDEISAYPNPARQFGGRIRFDLKESGPVEVIVADVAGRKVAQLSSGYQFAGPHEISLEGAASDGRELASGIYFVKLERNGTELARSKLTIVR